MPFTKRSSTVCLATVFVVLACLALIGLDVWRTWQTREDRLATATVSASNMAQALAQHADDTFKEADIVLQVLLEHIAEDGLSEKALPRIHRQLVAQVNELPQLNGVFVYDDKGRWVVNSRKTLETQFNNSDRDYFQYHRTHDDSAPYVGPPVQSRSTGRWIFTLSRRIDKADGTFGGVVLATIELDYFRKYYESFDVGREGGILFGLNSGTMLVRRTAASVTTGKDLHNIEIYRDYASKMPTGVAEMVSPIDGILRINSFTHLQKYPMFMVVAVSKNEVLAEWRRGAWMRTIGVIFLVGVFAAMGRRIVRDIKSKMRSEYEAVNARNKSDQLNVTLAQLAMHDGLTGLANRRKFDRTINSEMTRLAKENGPMSLLLIDVDNFKLYNDIYGHAKGDDCLKAVAAAIGNGERRQRDLAARYGGEEFALILPDCDIEGATVMAYNLRQAIADLQLSHSGSKNGRVSISIGVASFEPVKSSDTALMLIEKADQALYQAKQTGRDRVVSSPPRLAVIPHDELLKRRASRSSNSSQNT